MANLIYNTLITIALIIYFFLILPFIAVSLIVFIPSRFISPSKESFYVKLINKVPVLYEIHTLICTYPVWEKRFNNVPLPTGRVLHLACGTGLGAITISSKANMLIGLDINRKFLLYGKQRGRLKNPVAGSVYLLPFKNRQFDSVIILVSLHHLHSLSSLFFECKRVMNKNAALTIFDPVSLKNRTKSLWNTFHDGIIWKFDKDTIQKEVREQAKKCNFKIVSVRFFRTRSLQNFNLFYNMGDIVIQLKNI